VGEGHTERPSPDLDRLTVAQAAGALNISQDAVRKRIARGTIPHDRDESGRVYVYLPSSKTVRKADQDTVQDDASKTVQDAYIRSLEDQIGFLRRELERKDAILLNLTERIPQLEAPSELREAAETVEEQPERAGPRPATGGAQEGAASPQQRNGWLAPVDKLPWWHYVLGLVAMVVGTVAGDFLYSQPGDGFVLAIVFLGLPSSMGVWVGLRQRYVRVWRRVVPFGALLGVAFITTRVLYTPGLLFRSAIAATAALNVVAPCLLYVSGVLIGNAVQRRVTGRRSGTIPASPLSRTTSAATGSGTGWTPRQQAILGFVGTVVAALLGLFGSVIGAIVASGG
jgi:hypothetical protein